MLKVYEFYKDIGFNLHLCGLFIATPRQVEALVGKTVDISSSLEHVINPEAIRKHVVIEEGDIFPYAGCVKRYVLHEDYDVRNFFKIVEPSIFFAEEREFLVCYEELKGRAIEGCNPLNLEWVV